jgi:hypothetical protein
MTIYDISARRLGNMGAHVFLIGYYVIEKTGGRVLVIGYNVIRTTYQIPIQTDTDSSISVSLCYVYLFIYPFMTDLREPGQHSQFSD